MKLLSISANQTSIKFNNVYTGAPPNLVVVNLVSIADLAGNYQRNLFNFRNFGVNRIELKRNGKFRPIKGYTLNFATGQYIKAYSTFLQNLECDTGNKSVSHILSEWANKYTLYAFKIIDCPIGLRTYGPQSKSATGSERLEVLFTVAITKTSRWSCFINCWAESSLIDFTSSSYYKSWQWTSRWRDRIFSLKACG